MERGLSCLQDRRGHGSSVVMCTSPHDGVHGREAEAEPELRCPGSQAGPSWREAAPETGGFESSVT